MIHPASFHDSQAHIAANAGKPVLPSLPGSLPALPSLAFPNCYVLPNLLRGFVTESNFAGNIKPTAT
jgi:hypothetical protein